MNKKHKKVYMVLNYIEQVFILVSAVTVCVSISAFGSLVVIRVDVASYSVELKICVITARIKQHKSS